MCHQPWITLLIVVSMACAATADRIVLDGTRHEDVLVTESPSFYIVQFPDTGKIQRLKRTAVDVDDLGIEMADKRTRDSLLARWHDARGTKPAELPKATEAGRRARLVGAPGELPAPRPRVAQMDADLVEIWRLTGRVARRVAYYDDAPPGGPYFVFLDDDGKDDWEQGKFSLRQIRPEGHAPAPWEGDGRPRAGATSANGTTAKLRLRDVPLRDALDAILRPLHLDYEVRDYGIYISTPDRLRQNTARNMTTRVYQNVGGAETLPKIVVGSPSVYPQTVGGGFGGSVGGRSVAGGLVGGGFSGGQAGSGGFGNNGGGFANGGGFGGGNRGRAYSPLNQINNVSQLFTTINDASVGEPPPMLGYSYATPSRR